MNQKEISELKRRFRPDKNAISRIYGCYVSNSKEVISYIDESMGMLPVEEAEKYLGLLKKTFSGSLGKNLIDIVFSTQQVADSDEHRLLMALRDSGLKDGEVRQEFYQKVINSLDMGDSNYLILLAHDAYDVPYRGKDDETQTDASDQVFSYIVCCICPVKDGKMELGYCPGENEFQTAFPARWFLPQHWAFCSLPSMTGPPTSTTLWPIPVKRTSCTKNFWTPFSTLSRPCLQGSSVRRSKPPSARLWMAPAVWKSSRLSMSS